MDDKLPAIYLSSINMTRNTAISHNSFTQAEVEFIAENLLIEIRPNFSLEHFHFLGGKTYSQFI